MHHTSSTIVSFEGVDLQKPLLGISQIDGHLHSYERPICPPSPVPYWPPSPISYWPTKPSFTWPPSPTLYWPPSPVPYWPTKLISFGPLSLSRDRLLRNGQLLCSPFGQRPSPWDWSSPDPPFIKTLSNGN
ncbi:hypothetical protein DEO72_LG4g1232 [Vigna unguiculata]|uniref:Uncharacterized protein n=1 Tax=Vigna unguiculata TaxID=3917 RepID=A0A4D6LP02_VIGUN|nr:hypothetical protein DEO72_LG4g1232 [Vigna unguiculata]